MGFERYRARFSTPAPPAAPAPGTPHPSARSSSRTDAPDSGPPPGRQLQRLLPQLLSPRISPIRSPVSAQLATNPWYPAGDSIRSIRFPGDAHGPHTGDRPRPGRLFPSVGSPPFSPPAFDHDPTARQLRHRLVQDRKVLLPASVSSSRDKVGCDASPWPSSKAAVPRRVCSPPASSDPDAGGRRRTGRASPAPTAGVESAADPTADSRIELGCRGSCNRSVNQSMSRCAPSAPVAPGLPCPHCQLGAGLEAEGSVE